MWAAFKQWAAEKLSGKRKLDTAQMDVEPSVRAPKTPAHSRVPIFAAGQQQKPVSAKRRKSPREADSEPASKRSRTATAAMPQNSFAQADFSQRTQSQPSAAPNRTFVKAPRIHVPADSTSSVRPKSPRIAAAEAARRADQEANMWRQQSQRDAEAERRRQVDPLTPRSRQAAALSELSRVQAQKRAADRAAEEEAIRARNRYLSEHYAQARQQSQLQAEALARVMAQQSGRPQTAAETHQRESARQAEHLRQQQEIEKHRLEEERRARKLREEKLKEEKLKEEKLREEKLKEEKLKEAAAQKAAAEARRHYDEAAEAQVQARVDRRRRSMTRREIEAANEAHSKENIAAVIRPRMLLRICNLQSGSLMMLRALLPTVGPNAIAVTGLESVQPNNADAVKNAYKKAMAKLHPDRTQHLPTLEDRVEAEELYKLLNSQYERLK